ncbi:MAG: sugar ABC transporter ATP-binding protein [bacterium]|nr:sugar ABC transporter ATP-binding protein [bacterium]
MEKAVLEIKNLSKYFGGLKAVDGVDLTLHEKEIIALVGDNGAGKSTLIKTITGVYKKNSGRIFINGKEVEINSTLDARKNGIETVYQSEGAFDSFDAPANLFFGREKLLDNFLGKIFRVMDRKYMKKETEGLLKKVGVEIKNLAADISDLSGGQRQSVVVGRAVYWGGNILIFDEPTNNLGAMQQRKVISLIKRIREEYDVAIIIISHNISHVLELVDRIVVLRNGKIGGERLKKETNHNEIVSLITGVDE